MVTQQGRAILALILIIILLSVGSFYIGRYTQNNSSLQPSPTPKKEIVSPSSAVVASINPSVNPFDQSSSAPQPKTNSSSSPLKADVEIREEADGKVYTDNKHGFSYKFSKTLSLNNSVSDVNFAQFLEYQQGTGNVARMVMQIFENPQNSNLEVIKREGLLNGNDMGPKFEYLKVDGHDAVKLTKTMTQNEICNDGDGSTKNRIFYFLVKGDGYVVEIHPNDSCESFKRDWFGITPLSFQFQR